MKPKILVVDDEPSHQQMLEAVLVNEGYEVQQAHDGQEAIKAVEGSFYDLILMDVRMPRMGGIEALQKIKELSPVSIKVTGSGCEMLLYFRTTSEYDYKDAREPASEKNKMRENKYPTVIDVKFSNGDHLDILEFFDD